MARAKLVKILISYGATHALIDATCAAMIFSLPLLQHSIGTNFIKLIILYNILAFGLQSIFGLITDHLKCPKAAAIIGIIVTGISALLLTFTPIVAIILVGIGNALFHVGAGGISLNLTPKKATAPGIFVAPGAIGVLVGTLIGRSGGFVGWNFALLLAIIIIVLWLIPEPSIDYDRQSEEIPAQKVSDYFGIIMILILVSVAIRSLVSGTISFPWKADFSLLLCLTTATVLGKSLGGIVADKFGWMKTAIISLVISLPLLSFGANLPILALLGIFLFNFTMPITLVIISNILPGRPSLAFGIASTALVLGALPIFSENRYFSVN